MLPQSQIQGLHRMILNHQLDAQRELKWLKEQQKSMILVKTMLMLWLIQRFRHYWAMVLVSFLSTLELFQKMQVEVNDVNSNGFYVKDTLLSKVLMW